MKFQTSAEEEPQITLTPLIDVVFLMLIFFMVSTTVSKESRLQVQLPDATVEPVPLEESKQLQIEISKEGFFAVRGPLIATQPLLNPSFAALSDAIDSATGGKRELVVVIRADRETHHEAVIKAMDVVRRLGYTQLTFSTETVPRGSN